MNSSQITVGELVEILQNVPQDRVVLVSNGFKFFDIDTVDFHFIDDSGPLIIEYGYQVELGL